jgi:GNAT superfamily N-acetyltransferase
MKNFRIVVEPHADEKLKQVIRDNLGVYSLLAAGQEEYYSLSVFLRDENEEILGGVLGEIWGQWLFLSHVWLAAPLRRSGYGRQLLSTAEHYATEKGCHNVWLTTHSFQARPFYEKLGYEVFSQLDEFPPGHKLYFLKKKLAGGGLALPPTRQARKKPVV